MTRLIALIALLTCTACGDKKLYVDPPALPELPKEVAETCPPLPLVSDRAIGTLALADVESSALYAACRARGDAAVQLYNDARNAVANSKASQKK